jgi:hypothetical protein
MNAAREGDARESATVDAAAADASARATRERDPSSSRPPHPHVGSDARSDASEAASTASSDADARGAMDANDDDARPSRRRRSAARARRRDAPNDRRVAVVEDDDGVVAADASAPRVAMTLLNAIVADERSNRGAFDVASACDEDVRPRARVCVARSKRARVGSARTSSRFFSSLTHFRRSTRLVDLAEPRLDARKEIFTISSADLSAFTYELLVCVFCTTNAPAL